MHKNERIAKIEKFTYLIGYLEIAPLLAVGNVSLMNHLYSSMGTFERKVQESPTYNLLINDLIKLNKVNGANVNELRELYDRIKSNVGALKTVRIQQEYFESLLIPIFEKIPNVIQTLQIRMQLGKGNWNN